MTSKDDLTQFFIDATSSTIIYNNVRQLQLAQQQRFASISRPMYTPAIESPLKLSIDTQLGEGPFVPPEEAITTASAILLQQQYTSSLKIDAQMSVLRGIAESVCGREEAEAVGITMADALSIVLFLQENVCTKLNRAICENNRITLHTVRGFVLHLVNALRKLPRYKGSPVLYKAVKRTNKQNININMYEKNINMLDENKIDNENNFNNENDILNSNEDKINDSNIPSLNNEDGNNNVEIVKGKVLVWPGFVSATCDEESVLDFLASDTENDEKLLIEIRGKFVGYNIRSFTGCCGEDEVVLEPETTFKIVDVQRDIQFPMVKRVVVEVTEPQLSLRGALASFHI